MKKRRRNALEYRESTLFPARQIIQSTATRRQLRFLDDHHRKTVLDLEAQGATLTDQPIAFQREGGVAGVHWAAEDVEEFLTDHWRFQVWLGSEPNYKEMKEGSSIKLNRLRVSANR